jgi:cytidine deaminase/broad-specificity NMP kinase
MKQPLVRILGMDGSGKTTICDTLEAFDPGIIAFGSTPRYAYRWLQTYGVGKSDEVTTDQIDIRQHVFMKMNEQEAYLHDSLTLERPVVAVRGRADTWISANALRGKPIPQDIDVLFPRELRPDLLVVLTADPRIIEQRLDEREEIKRGANSMEYHRRTQDMYDKLATVAKKHMPVLQFDTGKKSLTSEVITKDILAAIHDLQPKGSRAYSFNHQLKADIKRAVNVAHNQAYPRDKVTKVGCVLRADGKIFTGANIKRWSWNTTTCSERAALDKALAAGITSLDRVVIYAQSTDNSISSALAPCGSCRELLKEALFHLGQSDLPIFLVAPDGESITETSLSHLLPYSKSLTRSQ